MVKLKYLQLHIPSQLINEETREFASYKEALEFICKWNQCTPAVWQFIPAFIEVV